jgi:hypothetical protein
MLDEKGTEIYCDETFDVTFKGNDGGDITEKFASGSWYCATLALTEIRSARSVKLAKASTSCATIVRLRMQRPLDYSLSQRPESFPRGVVLLRIPG